MQRIPMSSKAHVCKENPKRGQPDSGRRMFDDTLDSKNFWDPLRANNSRDWTNVPNNYMALICKANSELHSRLQARN